jgi:SnoaL-like protein
MSDERDIQQVIAKYVRAVDRRDGVALAGLFIPNGKVTIFYTNGGKEEYPKVAGSNPAPATIENEGLADASAANPFRLPRLHPGIGFADFAERLGSLG